jgi:hypothetical protein
MPAREGRRVRAAALFHPRVLVDLVSGLISLAPRRWWARPPFLPLPDRAWLRFRLESAYGDEGARPPVGDALAFLAWRRQQAGVKLPDIRPDAR